MYTYLVQFDRDSVKIIHAAEPDNPSGIGGFSRETSPVCVLCTGVKLSKIVPFTFFDDQELKWHLPNCTVAETIRSYALIDIKNSCS